MATVVNFNFPPRYFRPFLIQNFYPNDRINHEYTNFEEQSGVKFPPRFLLSLLFVNFHPTPNFHSFHSRPFKTVRRIDLYLSRPMHLSLLMVKLDDTRGLTFKNDSLYSILRYSRFSERPLLFHSFVL